MRQNDGTNNHEIIYFFIVTSSNVNRLAKNTVFLYIRTVFVMLIALYTSRLVLQALGVEDFGIYSVVTSMVTMFAIFSGSFSSSISRFITFELKNKNNSRIVEIFWASVLFQLFIATLAACVIFPCGYYVLTHELNITPERMEAAAIVFYCSVGIFCLNICLIPFQAEVIAHEYMGIFAGISCLDAGLKFAAAYGLNYATLDNLIVYSQCLATIAVVQFILYVVVCLYYFSECRKILTIFEQFKAIKEASRDINGFAAWNLFGCCAQVLNTQGLNLIFNIFFGLVTNAARGISVQVEAAVMQFVNSFTMALNPQITKSYASGDTGYMMELVYRGAKYSYLLLLVFAVPFLLEADKILQLWLGTPPDYAATFVRLSILVAMASILSQTMITAMLATGKIRQYQIVVGTAYAMVFPLSWIAFKWGCPAESAYVIYFGVNCVCLAIRIYMLKPLIPISGKAYCQRTLVKVLPVTALTFIVPGLVCYYFESSFIRLVAVCALSLVSTVGLSYGLALDPQEREFLRGAVQKVVKPLHR